MRVKKDKYLLSEIANEFIKQEIGNELTLLECLREGQIKAFTMYPEFNPQEVEIPEEYWKDLQSSEFMMADNVPHSSHKQAYLVKGEFAYENESECLDTMISAIEAKNLEKMDNRYREYLEKCGLNKKKPSNDEWKSIIKIYGDLRHMLNDFEEIAAFPAYVRKDNWENFTTQYLGSTDPIAESAKKGWGRPEGENWKTVYEQIISRLLNDPLSGENLKTLANEIDDWIHIQMKNENKKRNAYPETSTIHQKLCDIKKKN